MAAEGLIAIGADMSALERQLAALPKMSSDAAEKALARISRMQARASAQITAAVKGEMRAQKEVQRAAEKAAQAATRAAEQLSEKTRKGMEDLADVAGLPVDSIRKLSSSLAFVATPAGAATVAVAAIGAAVTAGVVAVAAFGVGIVAVVRKAGELKTALKPFEQLAGFEGLPAAAAASIDRAVGALDALGTIVDRVVLALGANLAPAVERAAFTAVKLGLAGMDIAQAWLGTHDVLRSFARFTGGVLISTLTSPLAPLALLVQGMAAVASAAGVDVPESVRHATLTLQQLATAAGERLADGALDALSGALDGVSVSLGDYDARARALVGTEVLLAQKAREHGAARNVEAEGLKAANAAMGAYADALRAARAPLDELTESDRLAGVRDALVASALAAETTGTELRRVVTTVDQLDARIAGLAADTARALALPGEALQQATDDAVKAATMQARVVEDTMSSIPWARMYAQGMLKATAGAAKKAGSVLSTITGGALSGLGSISGALQAMSGGAKSANAMADAAISFVTSLADNIGPFIEALAARLPEIVMALAKAMPEIVAALVRALPAVVVGLAKAFGELGVYIGKAIWQVVADAMRELGTLGRAKTKTFGDTPGPQRADRGGMRASFAPGDYVAAARSMKGLRDQVGASSSPGSVVVSLDVRDGPVRLGISRATRRAVERSGLGRDSSGRSNPYAA